MNEHLKLGPFGLKVSNLSKSTLKQLFKDHHKPNYVYYNYYDSQELKNVLLSTDYISKLNIISDIIDIICNFYPITKWSSINKSNNIYITNSIDNTISYANIICQDTHNIINDNNKNIIKNYNNKSGIIFFNEWIDLNFSNEYNKFIYRYIFKVHQFYEIDKLKESNELNFSIDFFDLGSSFQIGLTSNKFNKNINKIGFDINGESICWNCDGKICGFYYKSSKINDDNNINEYYSLWNSFKISKGFTINNKNNFFMIEIDLKYNKFKIKCYSIVGIKFIITETSIPSQLLKTINQTKMFRIGVSFKLDTFGSFALGLVKA